jgi:hypothetical protein
VLFAKTEVLAPNHCKGSAFYLILTLIFKKSCGGFENKNRPSRKGCADDFCSLLYEFFYQNINARTQAIMPPFVFLQRQLFGVFNSDVDVFHQWLCIKTGFVVTAQMIG